MGIELVSARAGALQKSYWLICDALTEDVFFGNNVSVATWPEADLRGLLRRHFFDHVPYSLRHELLSLAAACAGDSHCAFIRSDSTIACLVSIPLMRGRVAADSLLRLHTYRTDGS